jgi:hypothetical protein
MRYGGEDWHAQISAQMLGWKAKAFPDLRIYHHRPTGSGDANYARSCFREGRADYAMGSDLAFEIAKCARRVGAQFGAHGLFRLAGYLWSAVIRERRQVGADFVNFLRHDQRARIRGTALGLFNRVKVQSFFKE